ncbi:MAG: bifunctional oligoribonuclease/PAP phosphatase NrnA, partial [Spirochaetaceae bacterium]|nr:bifunctional oligoribonuclease/PAP phosphatase NrnA [Spirochaetaceae bacterium]
IVGHKEPDGDCVGSQLALGSFLRRMGKDTAILSAGPFTRTEILSYEHRFTDTAPEERASERAAAIVLDCSSLQRVGSVVATLPKVPLAFIDHHASGEAVGEVIYIDEKAPAVTLMVLALIEAMGQKPTKEEAELLLFGLCTDTGFFRHLDEHSSETFAAASRLVAAGASPKRGFSMMYGGKSLFSRKLMGEILTRTEPYFEDRLLVSYVTLDDQQRYGLASRDSDMLYQLLLSVAGCEAAIIIRQESETDCTVGLRARERVDVGSVAARFGGGGHRLAAGLSIRGRIEEVRERLLEAFAPAFDDLD